MKGSYIVLKAPMRKPPHKIQSTVIPSTQIILGVLPLGKGSALPLNWYGLVCYTAYQKLKVNGKIYDLVWLGFMVYQQQII